MNWNRLLFFIGGTFLGPMVMGIFTRVIGGVTGR
jgi:hypothetical protein